MPTFAASCGEEIISRTVRLPSRLSPANMVGESHGRRINNSTATTFEALFFAVWWNLAPDQVEECSRHSILNTNPIVTYGLRPPFGSSSSTCYSIGSLLQAIYMLLWDIYKITKYPVRCTHLHTHEGDVRQPFLCQQLREEFLKVDGLGTGL